MFATFLASLDHTNISKQGTRIDLALEDAVASFIEDTTGTIIVFTDGDEDTMEIPSQVYTQIREKDIDVVIVGVGTKQ